MVTKTASASLPTRYGTFQLAVYRSDSDNLEHAVLTKGDLALQPIVTRLHSECLTGDVFGSLKCDCGAQLEISLKMISQAPAGILLYLNQEGRSIGLTNKIKAYALQEQGLDTVEANVALGFAPDLRNYQVAAEILKDLGITSISLLTNNPDKIMQLEKQGIIIAKQIPLETTAQPVNRAYLLTKKKKMGHQFELI